MGWGVENGVTGVAAEKVKGGGGSGTIIGY